MVSWESLSDKSSSKRKKTRGQGRVSKGDGGNGLRDRVALCVSGPQGRCKRIRHEG